MYYCFNTISTLLIYEDAQNGYDFNNCNDYDGDSPSMFIAYLKGKLVEVWMNCHYSMCEFRGHLTTKIYSTMFVVNYSYNYDLK